MRDNGGKRLCSVSKWEHHLSADSFDSTRRKVRNSLVAELIDIYGRSTKSCPSGTEVQKQAKGPEGLLLFVSLELVEILLP